MNAENFARIDLDRSRFDCECSHGVLQCMQPVLNTACLDAITVDLENVTPSVKTTLDLMASPTCAWVGIVHCVNNNNNKKAELTQRRPRDASNIWVP